MGSQHTLGDVNRKYTVILLSEDSENQLCVMASVTSCFFSFF